MLTAVVLTGVVFVVGPALAADHSVLFVGNSYTGSNTPNLAASYGELVAEGQPQWAEVVIAAHTPGGRTLAQHFADATAGGTLEDLLHGAQYTWDFVVLQDQSQVPGFPQWQQDWVDSRDGAVGLAGISEAVGAKTRLLQTWGGRDGCSVNTERFPTYLTMQELLIQGYADYAAAIVLAGHEVSTLPAGEGWRAVYQDLEGRGVAPQSGDTLFTRLYAGDGSHPAPEGTYLAACIVYAALTGDSPVGLSWAHGGISAADRDALQAVADVLVLGSDDDHSGSDDDDSGSDDDDSGSDDDDSGSDDDDSSADGSPDPTGSVGEAQSGEGCGCAASPHQRPPLASLVVLLLLGAAGALRRSNLGGQLS